MTVDVQPVTLALPRPRGELSAAVVALLRGETDRLEVSPAPADPYGEDLQLALHTCYELHYQGFTGVDPELEWDPRLLSWRAGLENRFLAALRADVAGGTDLDAELEQLLVEPVEATGIGAFLRAEGEWWHMREYFAHRSIYHLKEADPYAWAIPRLRGQAKAALVAVEFDEFGGGRGDRVHAQLFADLLDGAGLNSGYLHYLDVVPAPMLALVNMMSLFGLHRRWRGALVGHFATVEITSPPAARRMAEALTRLAADPACVFFYTEHVEADAVHEQVMRRDVIADLIAREPDLTESVVLGIQVTNLLESRIERHVLQDSWRAGRSSLLAPGLQSQG
ncbi:iron-containing redox enzyme family protein [Nocardia sp. CDC159]|uniref:Iron-containing redox enzyme family protein n=1 Tax=Nocardia pulmonis TaxID=2951408 RepID=A0A9X2IXT5_9NOCA|nr:MULTISPECIES: iron-containing redox enzyme family protein [Nocardia]MCM6774220.1 iron-containing redox enzyme family protein [Nocardia pulmonis]MCM6787107.1 iron-containing redox enzyme family protein [Nocardia sp. CDC159]